VRTQTSLGQRPRSQTANIKGLKARFIHGPSAIASHKMITAAADVRRL